jgi:hypothetical protein
MVELLLSYALISNEPLYLREADQPYKNIELSLLIGKDLGKHYFLYLEPYVMAEGDLVGRAGGKAELGIRIWDFEISLFHHSAHDLDKNNRAIEVDGIRMRWRLH